MRIFELERYKAALEAKRADLAEALPDRERIVVEKAPDAFDNLQLAAERDLAMSQLDRVSNLLRTVGAALARIDDGSYGICLNCEEPISPRRLQAVPWTAYCVRCQEMVDRGELKNQWTNDVELLDAA